VQTYGLRGYWYRLVDAAALREANLAALRGLLRQPGRTAAPHPKAARAALNGATGDGPARDVTFRGQTPFLVPVRIGSLARRHGLRVMGER